MLIEALVICLSVIPAALFTWYSHNQEILQEAKRGQLFLAKSLEKRRNDIHHQVTAIYPGPEGEHLFDTLQYARGIYGINGDRISRMRGPIRYVDPESEKFYFRIQEYFSTDYYDPQSYPVLQTHSADFQWQWARPESGHLEFAYNMSPDNYGVQGDSNKNVLIIRSSIPPRYAFLSYLLRMAALALVIFALLWGLYKLIRRICEGIFLQKFVRLESSILPAHSTLPLIDDWCRNEGLEGSGKERMIASMQSTVFQFTPTHYENLMDQAEYQTIMNVKQCERYYSFVWEQGSPGQKYLLYNFASNGFLNYKNATEIYLLMEKGIFIVREDEIRVFSSGFRAFILQHTSRSNEDFIPKELEKTSPWESFKLPFLILLFTAAAFVFFTQQEAWQRISALITGVSTSLPLLINLFKIGARSRA